MEPTEHFGIYFGYIRRLFQSRVSPFKYMPVKCIAPSVDGRCCAAEHWCLPVQPTTSVLSGVAVATIMLANMGGGTGGGGGDRSPANFLAFNIMPMDVAWKESTSNGSRPLQSSRRGAALACEFAARHLTKLQGWRNDSRGGGGGGLGLGGPRGKGSPSVSKGPKPPIQLGVAMAEKQFKRSKKCPFSLYIGSPWVPSRNWN